MNLGRQVGLYFRSEKNMRKTNPPSTNRPGLFNVKTNPSMEINLQEVWMKRKVKAEN